LGKNARKQRNLKKMEAAGLNKNALEHQKKKGKGEQACREGEGREGRKRSIKRAVESFTPSNISLMVTERLAPFLETVRTSFSRLFKDTSPISDGLGGCESEFDYY